MLGAYHTGRCGLKNPNVTTFNIRSWVVAQAGLKRPGARIVCIAAQGVRIFAGARNHCEGSVANLSASVENGLKALSKLDWTF
jgi:hypothetical protein